MSEEDKGFKVKDHRAFAKEDQATDGKEEEQKSADEPRAPAAEEPTETVEDGEQFQLPQINLAIAKQTIDILSMLQEKTVGNLSQDEESMLKSILYDLKINYVKEKG